MKNYLNFQLILPAVAMLSLWKYTAIKSEMEQKIVDKSEKQFN